MVMRPGLIVQSLPDPSYRIGTICGYNLIGMTTYRVCVSPGA